jgi:hypothetical protein
MRRFRLICVVFGTTVQISVLPSGIVMELAIVGFLWFQGLVPNESCTGQISFSILSST